jgi:hypothetical protein
MHRLNLLKNKEQQMHNQQLNEGLRSNDLKDMVHSVLTIDTHRSKMGEDRDVCVLSFRVNDRNPAKDHFRVAGSSNPSTENPSPR